MPDRQGHAGRGGSLRLILPALLLAGIACSGSTGEGTATTGPTVTTLPSTTATAAPATTATTQATTTTAPVDPVALAEGGLAASSANYRFTSVVLVGEETLTTIDGIVDGSSVSADITTGTSALSYVRTPEGEWVTESEGDWVALEGEPPATPPLDALVDAGNLALESGDSSQAVLTGTLGAAAGSAQGVPFSITIEEGLIREIRYQVDTGGEIAQVITSLSEIGTAGTVSAPEGV